MELTKETLQRVYFLTRTSISEQRLLNLARYNENFQSFIDQITRLGHVDLDKDWSLFDYEYKIGKLIYAEHTKLIDESKIFKGTYTHRCKNDLKYLIPIIGSSGYCRRCDTQFFPKLWWDNPQHEAMDYLEIKYGRFVKKQPVTINLEYIARLSALKVDRRILEQAVQTVHSPLEIEKMLNTKLYDWHHPPPAAKIHHKLLLLSRVWESRPVKQMGIHQDSSYFFHHCHNNVERILFQERYLYTWCPACFTKFIPVWDKETIRLYKNIIAVKSYSDQDHKKDNPPDATEAYETSAAEPEKPKISRDSPEFYYLSVLGLKDRTSAAEIYETFRKLSKVYHPDLGGNSHLFQQIVKAKNWLIRYYKYSIHSD